MDAQQLVGEVVRVEGWRGIAFMVDEALDNETVSTHMVGDDRDFVFDVSKVSVLSDDEYCGGCGQIGCGH